MDSIKVGLGHSADPQVAILQALEGNARPDLVICFASFGTDMHALYALLREHAGTTAAIIGGTSAGEFSSLSAQPATGTVVVMTLKSSNFNVGVGVGEYLSENPAQAANTAVTRAYAALLSNPSVMSLMAIAAMDSKGSVKVSRIKPFFNLVLPDGTSGQEEAFLRGLLKKIGTVSPIVGGSTANDFSASRSYQLANGVYQDAAVVASFSSGLKVGTAMGHPYVPSNKGVIVTSSQGRTVHTLNGRPAADVLTQVLEVEALSDQVFAEHPFGVKSPDVFGEYTIKSAAAVNDDGSVTFYSEVPQGVFMRVMKTDRDTAIRQFRETLLKAVRDAGSPKRVAAVIVFNCILRHLLKCRLEVDDLSVVREVFGEDVPLIGFNTFGEQGLTMGGAVGHYNQTSTVLVIADEVITE
jgi:hypothetical protein